MIAYPTKNLELHYPLIQILIISFVFVAWPLGTIFISSSMGKSLSHSGDETFQKIFVMLLKALRAWSLLGDNY